MSAPQPVSNWWYLAPIIFGILGGIYAWFRVRKTDPRKARMMIIFGFSWTLAWWIVGDFILDPMDEEFNQFCAAEFDKQVSGEKSSPALMNEELCFMFFDDWKNQSTAYHDGSAEEMAQERGMTLDEAVEFNVQRELGLD